MEFKIDEWDDKKFVTDLRKSFKDKTPLSFSKKDIQKEIIRHTGCDVDDSEKCFQKMVRKGLDLCTAEISLLVPNCGTQYNVTEYGLIRNYLNPKDMEKE